MAIKWFKRAIPEFHIARSLKTRRRRTIVMHACMGSYNIFLGMEILECFIGNSYNCIN